MIQRIQSVLLAIVAIVMFANAAVLPIWSASDGEKAIYLMAKSMIQVQNEQTTELESPIVILILAVLSGIIAIFSISQYKNRMTQMKLGALNSLLIGGTLIAEVYYKGVGESLLNQSVVKGGFLIGFWMPVIAALMNFMANRFIRRDERLVRDSDRLR